MMARVRHSKSPSTSAFHADCPRNSRCICLLLQREDPAKILCPFKRQIKGSLQTSFENKDVYFEKDFKSWQFFFFKGPNKIANFNHKFERIYSYSVF